MESDALIGGFWLERLTMVDLEIDVNLVMEAPNVKLTAPVAVGPQEEPTVLLCLMCSSMGLGCSVMGLGIAVHGNGDGAWGKELGLAVWKRTVLLLGCYAIEDEICSTYMYRKKHCKKESILRLIAAVPITA
ncbi:hypothetical protein U1Q18_007910 [Sarracenia purpurea var. burkii]